jgi:hypothetical protein
MFQPSQLTKEKKGKRRRKGNKTDSPLICRILLCVLALNSEDNNITGKPPPKSMHESSRAALGDF